MYIGRLRRGSAPVCGAETPVSLWSHVHNGGTGEDSQLSASSATAADVPTTVGRSATLNMTPHLPRTRAGWMPVRFTASLLLAVRRRGGRRAERKPAGSRRDLTATGSATISDSNRSQRSVPNGRAGPDQIGKTEQRQGPRRYLDGDRSVSCRRWVAEKMPGPSQATDPQPTGQPGSGRGNDQQALAFGERPHEQSLFGPAG
jgi:hypothetical protein